MHFQILIINLISGLFDYFIMELFTLTFFKYSHPYQKTYYRYLFLGIELVISVLPNIPYALFLYAIISFTYFCLISSFHIKDSLIFCIKYQFIDYLILFFTGFICSFINSVMYITEQDLENTFFDYQGITSMMLTYILLYLYINTKRLKELRMRTIYPLTFSVLSTMIIFFLLLFNNILAKYENLSVFMPWLYIAFSGILALSLNSYHKIIDALEEQMNQRVALEKYELELSYLGDIQHSLDTLSHVRHDFKNHLITLDYYASQNRITELRDYIAGINTTLVNTKLISTSNDLISSILNAKNAVCQRQNVSFQANCDFDQIQVSDFALITILGNLLDNAITAASQTEAGYVELSIFKNGNLLEICCENNHNGNIIENNGVFTSTKEDNGLHGLGIENIRSCTDSLHGTIKFTHDEAIFRVEIMLPNRAK